MKKGEYTLLAEDHVGEKIIFLKKTCSNLIPSKKIKIIQIR